ncbi:TIR domain-containing protein [Desulfobacterales bacterium HSG16]|nr:TIR domain-containing protein [Desulfobacterales bacterium HSG16]
MADDVKVFISYAGEDYETAKKLYDDLKDGGVTPWIDKVDLLPGQRWKPAITKAIKQSRFFLALLSSRSVSEKGFFHAELKKALEVFDEFSEEEIFLIPLLIDDCEIPERLEHINCVELFPDYDKTVSSILRVLQADQKVEASKPVPEKPKQASKPEASQADPSKVSTNTAQGNTLQGVIQAGTVQQVVQHFHGTAAPDSDDAKAVPEKPRPDKKPVDQPTFDQSKEKEESVIETIPDDADHQKSSISAPVQVEKNWRSTLLILISTLVILGLVWWKMPGSDGRGERNTTTTKPKSVTTSTMPGVKPEAKEIVRDGHFIAYDDGTVLDEKTGLMWAVEDNGQDIDWKNAKLYCEEYQGGGYSDWRLPTIKELKGLYDRNKSYPMDCVTAYEVHLTRLIHVSCWRVWSSKTSGSSAAFFGFFNGNEYQFAQSSSGYFRVLPVRAGN